MFGDGDEEILTPFHHLRPPTGPQLSPPVKPRIVEGGFTFKDAVAASSRVALLNVILGFASTKTCLLVAAQEQFSPPGLEGVCCGRRAL